MSTITRKWQRPLTKAELDGLLTAINDAPTPLDALSAGLLGFFRLALPEATGQTWDEFMADETATLTPWHYAIPEDQWGALATAISDRSRAVDPLYAANAMMDWMNKGPSGYARPS